MISFDRPQSQIIRDMPSSDIYMELIKHGDDLFFEYKISFLIDQVLAYRAKVRSANVSISYKKVNQEFSPLSRVSDKSQTKINSQIRNLSKLRADLSKRISEEKITNTVYNSSFDIFSKIPKISEFRLNATGILTNSPSQVSLVKIDHSFRILSDTAPSTGIIIVNVEVKDAEDRQVQNVFFEINHKDILQKYNIPFNLPHAYTSPNLKDSIRLNAFANDDRINGVSVYTRNVNNSLADVNQTQFKKTYTAKVDSSNRYTTNLIDQNSLSSYEVRSVAELNSGIQLGNILSSTRKINQIKTISGLIYCVADKGYVDIFIKNLDPRYKYIQILRKEGTKLHQDWQPVNKVDVFTGNDYSFTDQTVRSNRVYLYTAVCQERMGDRKFISTMFPVRTSYYTPGIEISINSNVEDLLDGTFKRRFEMSLSLTQNSNITELLASFKSQGIDLYYDEELKKLSGNLDAIFKVGIRRVDVEKNEVTELGVKSIGTFEDVSSDNVVYIFEALYRNQSDLLEELGADVADQKALDPRNMLNQGTIVSNSLTSKKTIAQNNFTQKFLSKQSLLRGTLSYGPTKTRGPDTSGFLDGRLGITEIVDFSSKITTTFVTNAQIILSLNQQKLLSFDISTNQSQNIDYFEIYCLNNEKRIFLGRCHYNTGSSRQYYLDQQTDVNQVNVVYEIKPFKLDGTPLPSSITKTLRPN